MTYKGLPLYIVNFDDDTIFNNVSIVDMPANEINCITMSRDAEIQFSINEEKHIISGVVLIPRQKIYRNFNGKECYIEFNEKTIEKLAVKFFAEHKNTEGNVQHQFSVDGITFFESYLINKERCIAPVEFPDLPNGTWVLSAKVENEEVWKLIKEGVIKGFSIDIMSKIQEEKTIDTLQDFIDYLKNNNNE